MASPYSQERYALLCRLTDDELLGVAEQMGYLVSEATGLAQTFEEAVEESWPDSDPIIARLEALDEIRKALSAECDCRRCAPVLAPVWGYAASLPARVAR